MTSLDARKMQSDWYTVERNGVVLASRETYEAACEAAIRLAIELAEGVTA